MNADDYGLCDGVDRGIREAASAGIVTSVSVMADRVTKDAIARLLDVAPTVGLGLHADLTSDLRRFLPGDEAARVRAQAERFFDRVGRGPDHVNAHKHLHRGRRRSSRRWRRSASRCARTAPTCGAGSVGAASPARTTSSATWGRRPSGPQRGSGTRSRSCPRGRPR